MDDQSEQRLQLKRDFGEFLDRDHGRGPYLAKIDDLLKRYSEGGPLRLLVDMNDLHGYDPQLHQRVLQSPSECLPPFQEALDELIRSTPPPHLSPTSSPHITSRSGGLLSRLSPPCMPAKQQRDGVALSGTMPTTDFCAVQESASEDAGRGRRGSGRIRR